MKKRIVFILCVMVLGVVAILSPLSFNTQKKVNASQAGISQTTFHSTFYYVSSSSALQWIVDGTTAYIYLELDLQAVFGFVPDKFYFARSSATGTGTTGGGRTYGISTKQSAGGIYDTWIPYTSFYGKNTSYTTFAGTPTDVDFAYINTSLTPYIRFLFPCTNNTTSTRDYAFQHLTSYLGSPYYSFMFGLEAGVVDHFATKYSFISNTTAYSNGYTAGYNTVLGLLEEAYNEGYDEGLADGLAVEYDVGYTDGYDVGYDTAYDVGYGVGQSVAVQSGWTLRGMVVSVFGAVTSFLLTILEFEFLGISLGHVVAGLGMVAVVIIVLSFVKK